MRKILNIIGYITVLTALALVSVLLFWLLYPYEPVIINREPLEVVTKQVKAGDYLYYKVDRCRNNDSVVIIATYLVDHIQIPYPTTSVRGTIGCEIKEYNILIPANAVPGAYTLHFTYEFQVNPIRRIINDVQSEPFEVLPCEQICK